MKYLLLLCLCSTAHAQCTTLLYTGAPFTTVTTTGENISAVSSPLTGYVTLSAPLPANGVTTTPGVNNWDFTSASVGNDLVLTNGNLSFMGDSVSFSFTTVNGVVTNWAMSL